MNLDLQKCENGWILKTNTKTLVFVDPTLLGEAIAKLALEPDPKPMDSFITASPKDNESLPDKDLKTFRFATGLDTPGAIASPLR